MEGSALISASATKRRRPNAENHSYKQNNQYHYNVNCGDLENVMCHEAFASLHGIGRGKGGITAW